MANLTAYKFNADELKSMLDLKNLFILNEFEIDRFPEVYYDNYDEYEKLYGKLSLPDETIDFLGVYSYSLKVKDSVSEEGIIVLFKDRIESFCNKNNISVDSVRFIVLIHELGHWLTHWPINKGMNWAKGYNAGRYKKTHESLAQLITLWIVNGNPFLEKILFTYLTPTNVNNPYYLYNNLKHFSKTKILNNIVELRKHYFLSDEIMYKFLLSDNHNFIKDYLIEFFLKPFNPSGYTGSQIVFNDDDFPAQTREFDEVLYTQLEIILKTQTDLARFVSFNNLPKRLELFYSKEDDHYKELIKLFKPYEQMINLNVLGF